MTVQIDGDHLPVWTFGDRIRKARTIAGMDQRQFAETIEVNPSSLAAWETDRATPRNIVAISKRVEALTRIPAAWLLGVDAPPPANGQHGGGTPQGSQPSGLRTASAASAQIFQLRPTGLVA